MHSGSWEAVAADRLGSVGNIAGGIDGGVEGGPPGASLWGPIEVSIKMYEYDKNVYLPVLEAAQAECSAVANAASPQP